MGEYASYIWGAYGAAGVVLAALTAYLWRDMRRQRALLDELEARGTPRRRAAAAAASSSPEVAP